MHAPAFRTSRRPFALVAAATLSLLALGPQPARADAPPSQCGVATTTFTRSPISPELVPNGSKAFTMVVAGVGTVWDIDLRTFLTHTFSGDLSVTLTSPAGTSVSITTRNGGSRINVFNGTIWDDQATALGGEVVTLATYADHDVKARLSPEQPLAAFRDEDPNGTWTLTINDYLAEDTGFLNSWSLTLYTTAGAPTSTSPTGVYGGPAIPTVDLATVTATAVVAPQANLVSTVAVFLDVRHTTAADLVITLTSPSGTAVTMTSRNGAANDDVFGGGVWGDSGAAVTDYAFSNGVAALFLAPQEPFARFAGEPAGGTWTLSVADTVAGGSGQIVAFTVTTYTAPCAYIAPTTEGETEETGFTNNTAATAKQLQLASGVVGVAIGAIRPIGAAPAGNDLDYWKFTAAAGARVWATVDAGGTQHTGATTRDTFLSVVASDGTTFLASDDDDGPGTGGDASLEAGGSSNVASIVIPTSGTYYLRVTSGSAIDRTIDPYRLYVVVSSEPTRPGDAGVVPAGGTPTVTASTRIARLRGTITAGETDQYQINYLPAGSLVFISVDGDPDRTLSSFNPRIVFDNTSGLGSPLITINRAVSVPFVESMAYYLPAGATAMYFGVGGAAGNTGPYEVMVTVMQRRVANMSLIRGYGPHPAIPGASFATTFQFINEGPDDAGRRSFTTPISPVAGTFTSVVAPAMSCTTPAVGGNGLITCTANDPMTMGVTLSATANEVLKPDLLTPFFQDAGVLPAATPADLNEPPPAADYVTTNDSAQGSFPVAPWADVSISAGAIPGAIAAGATFVVDVLVMNSGPSTATGLSLSVTVPAHAVITGTTAPAGWTCGTPVLCTAASMQPFTTAAFTVSFTTVPSAPAGATISPSLYIASATTDLVPANNAITAPVMITNVTPTDTDGDGLLNDFETAFGLDPANPSGPNGPAGDPDGDGRSNIEEQTAGTHPRGFVQRYFAEGSTGAFFDERLAIVNPSGAATALVQVRYLRPAPQPPVIQNFTVFPNTRRTIEVDAIAGVENTAVSVVIESDLVVVADRTLTWDATGYGAHSETAVAAASTSWYFAEGTTASGFELFYLLQNAGSTPAHVTVTYLRPAPAAPVTRTYTVDPNSRFNIWVNTEGAELAGTDVSATISSDQPIIAERAMYRDAAGQTFGAGHDSVGVTAPAPEWFLAEGATGPFFDLFVLVANPAPGPSNIEARFLTPGGAVITRNYTVPGQSRFNIWVDLEDPALADTAVSTAVRTTNATNVIVERALWWPAPVANWYEAHNSAGATSTAPRWAIAEGEVGGPRGVDTYILLANPTGVSASVRVRLLFEDGTTTERTFDVAANSRFNVWTRVEFPTSVDRRFGAIVESLGASPTGIIVERAMYWDAPGQTWAAGTNALAARLP